MPIKRTGQSGFTMIELMLSMALFSFILLVIVVGFINIAQLHDEALATDQSQSSARSAMDALVQAVRNAQSVVSPVTIGTPSDTMCLASSTGGPQIYYVDNHVLYVTNLCTGVPTNWAPGHEPANTEALTDSSVQVPAHGFQATVETGGTGANGPIIPEVRLKLTVASNNGTTNSTGTQCLNSDHDRAFCSIVTLTSGAEPR